jgi:hypothetical protein
MKNKKGLIILSSVIVACAVGLVVSPLVDWAVDENNTSGNISKSSRFSRKTADEGLSNMEELMASDPDYKNGIVTAYMVMHTRAQQFSALVDMSNEVAGDIPEYAGVIDEMNKVYVTVNNVCASLMRAGENINATLNGEKRPDLAQNTINASLAYTTLQKQNKLATQFIDVTDEYVKNNEASDRLLFVRDQWVDYQLMTAALEGDTKSAEALEKKGSLLPAEKSVAALGSFEMAHQLTVLESACMSNTLDVENSIVRAVPNEVIVKAFDVVGSTSDMVQNVQTGGELNSAQAAEISAELRANYVGSLSNSIETQDFVKAVGWGQTVASQAVANQAVANQAVANQAVANQAVANQAVANQAVANQAVANQAVANQAVANQAVANQAVASQTVVSSFNIVGMHIGNLVSSFEQVSNNIKMGMRAEDEVMRNGAKCGELGSFISETSIGHVANLKFF